MKLSRRTAARYGAIQALHQLDLREEKIDILMHEFEAHFLNTPPDDTTEIDLRHADRKLYETLVEGVTQELETLKGLIEPHLVGLWTFDRIEPSLRWILLLATFELLRMRELDPAIIINEYINATKAFASTKEAPFVNNVLDKITKIVRPSAP
jgi:N utilization substance protein B